MGIDFNLHYESLPSDTKTPQKSSIMNSVKQGKIGFNAVTLKRNILHKAVSYTILFLLLAAAVFITSKLLPPVDGEVVDTGVPVYALEETTQTNVEPVVAPVVAEPTVIPPEPEKPIVEAPVATCHSEILKYDWDIRIATAVMMAESRGDTNALNNNPGTGDYSVGCFQVNIYGRNALNRPSEAQLRDPVVNVAFAYNLWRSTSWAQSWGAYSNGSYLRYLK